jgi:hypothetical protein
LRGPGRSGILSVIAHDTRNHTEEGVAMRRMLGLLALTLALGVLAAGGLSPVEAQDKAKTKKAKESDKKATKEAAVGTIEIYKAKDGFRFRIKDGDDKTMAIPVRGRETRAEVVDDIENIKAILAKARPTDAKD